jgi:hypothetical protein
MCIHIGLFANGTENVPDHSSQDYYLALLTLSFSFVSTFIFSLSLTIATHIRSRFFFVCIHVGLGVRCTLNDGRSWSYIIKEKENGAVKMIRWSMFAY